MKRRFTLVTAEEPIPKTDGDVQEQLPILKSVQELSTQSPCDNDVDEDDSDDGTQNCDQMWFHYILYIASLNLN